METTFLLIRLNSKLCAIPLAVVAECMRPLPAEPVPGTPPYLLGLAVIRGGPVPVVDLDVLLGGTGDGPRGRYVLLKFGERKLAIAVSEVSGVCQLPDSILREAPPLLQGGDRELMAAVGVRDDQLFFVLRAAKVVPDEVWRVLETNRLES
ncbi:chemotaxis protein CheW [Zavarzinella formosa]|uniref:chemotaxis protein CheW n=1 Tax=Zavarzinella formosa TaxID=360055 RepID=UPI0003096F8B|nr:chemotaxis protein CheW [Zavarzinella formosa]